MVDFVKPVYLIFLVLFVVPGILGGILAANRGRNVVGWAIICAIFPIFLLVIYFNKPIRDVEGKFRKCRSCGEFVKWGDASCKYCGAELSPHIPLQ